MAIRFMKEVARISGQESWNPEASETRFITERNKRYQRKIESLGLEKNSSDSISPDENSDTPPEVLPALHTMIKGKDMTEINTETAQPPSESVAPKESKEPQKPVLPDGLSLTPEMLDTFKRNWEAAFRKKFEAEVVEYSTQLQEQAQTVETLNKKLEELELEKERALEAKQAE